jgi:hypothetical protein
MSHLSVGGYFGVDVPTLLLVEVDLLLFLQNLNFVVPYSFLVLLAQRLQLALLGVV